MLDESRLFCGLFAGPDEMDGFVLRFKDAPIRIQLQMSFENLIVLVNDTSVLVNPHLQYCILRAIAVRRQSEPRLSRPRAHRPFQHWRVYYGKECARFFRHAVPANASLDCFK